jgi:hypothetical protein
MKILVKKSTEDKSTTVVAKSMIDAVSSVYAGELFVKISKTYYNRLNALQKQSAVKRIGDTYIKTATARVLRKNGSTGKIRYYKKLTIGYCPLY